MASGLLRRRGTWTRLLLIVMTLALVSGSSAASRICRAGVPAYFYPAPGSPAWGLAAGMAPGTLLVLNPDNGPGRAVDPNYTSVVRAMRTTEVELFGYVDTAYGSRDRGVMVAEARAWQEWYGVTGIFLDQTSSGGDRLDYYRDITDALHDLGLTVAMNPGQPDIDRRYLDLAEHVVTFEGPYEQYLDQAFPEWSGEAGDGKIWHLVYDVPSEDQMRATLSLASGRAAALAFATDGVMPNPWDRLPSYWPAQQQLLDRC